MYWNKYILITDIENKYGARAISYEFLRKKLKKKLVKLKQVFHQNSPQSQLLFTNSK